MGFIISTNMGDVEIKPNASVQDILALSMHPGIGDFADYRSIITNVEALAEQAVDARVALAVLGNLLLGYAVLRQPIPGERWREMPIMRELFCEVARGCRGSGIIETLLDCLHHQPEQEELILYLVGYSWHWDLPATGKNMQEYRQTLIHLVEKFGYKEYPTNEPNVGLRSENLFMARMGANLDTAQKRAFSRLLFGIAENW